MDTVTQVAAFTSLVTATIALGTWGVSQFIASRQAVRESRRQLVSRVLDVVDALVKQRTQPVLLIAWRRKEVDLTLLQTRLALDLKKKDRVVALWVWAQTERLVMAKDESEVTRRAVTIGSTLSFWHQGAFRRKWFREQLKLEPVIESLEIPRSAKWRLNNRLFWEVLGAGVVVLAAVFAGHQGKLFLQDIEDM